MLTSLLADPTVAPGALDARTLDPGQFGVAVFGLGLIVLLVAAYVVGSWRR